MYQFKRRTIQLSSEAYGCDLGLKWGSKIKQCLLKVVERSSECCTRRKNLCYPVKWLKLELATTVCGSSLNRHSSEWTALQTGGLHKILF